jgi:glucosamine-6-phosphate deaminase
MKIVIVKDYAQMSKLAADSFAEVINNKPDAVMGLATGSSPIGLYKELIKMNKEGKIDFSKVRSFNLDEYYKIAPDSDQSYIYFMKQNLFDHINIKPENINIPNGMAPDADAESVAYDKKIEAAGGIDIQILGAGVNGHIGFNEPEDALYFGTHRTELQESTIEANARFFSSAADVPKSALTMGVGHIMQAKKIVMVLSGENKRDVFKALKSGIKSLGSLNGVCIDSVTASNSDIFEKSDVHLNLLA